jgi:hypothetical protein
MSLALDKEVGFAECRIEHSAKNLTWGPSLAGSLSSVPSGTRQRWILCRVSPRTLGKAAVSVTRCRNGRFSLSSALWHSAKRFAECPRKSTRQRRLCRCTVCRAFFDECNTWQSLCRVFLRLRRVLQALGKAIDSGSDKCL